ncbi:MAG: hypothetical protein QW279_11800 [Candidatus Jordarchaeaceae archaeon]
MPCTSTGIIRHLTPFTIITIVAIVTLIPGIIPAATYLDHLKRN